MEIKSVMSEVSENLIGSAHLSDIIRSCLGIAQTAGLVKLKFTKTAVADAIDLVLKSGLLDVVLENIVKNIGGRFDARAKTDSRIRDLNDSGTTPPTGQPPVG